MAKIHYALEIWKEYTKGEDGFTGCSTEKRPLIKCDDCIHYESYGKHQEMGLGLCIQLPMRPRIAAKTSSAAGPGTKADRNRKSR